MSEPSPELLAWRTRFLDVAERLAQKMAIAAKSRDDLDNKVVIALKTEFAHTYRTKPKSETQ